MPSGVDVKVTSICGIRGAGGWKLPSRIELAEALVARGHVALALQHVDGHRGLVVVGGGEDLLRLGRDGSDHLMVLCCGRAGRRHDSSPAKPET